MIVDYHTAASHDMPKMPLKFFEMIHNMSMFLLLDDKHDIGRFSYYNRTDYYWKGRYSPDHPSPLHHWYLGWLGLITAQLGALAMKGLEIFDTQQKLERGDMSDVPPEILELFGEESQPISVEDYSKSISDIPLESAPPHRPLGYENNSKIKIPKVRLIL